jgi:hypothetical protein
MADCIFPLVSVFERKVTYANFVGFQILVSICSFVDEIHQLTQMREYLLMKYPSNLTTSATLFKW